MKYSESGPSACRVGVAIVVGIGVVALGVGVSGTTVGVGDSGSGATLEGGGVWAGVFTTSTILETGTLFTGGVVGKRKLSLEVIPWAAKMSCMWNASCVNC